MSDSGTDVQATLDAWRKLHADRPHPIRLHFIQALANRAAGQEGEARRILDDRLSHLIETHADDLETPQKNVEHTDNPPTPPAPARSALSGLIDHITDHPARYGSSARDDTPAPSPSFPQLEALGEFEKIWSRVHTDNQLRQSLNQAPTDAGPLNSASLVHRSLTLMQELSPGYLQQFLSYVDALSWMEHMCIGGSLTTTATPRAESIHKRARSKPRERRD
jgi:hypothetical protein